MRRRASYLVLTALIASLVGVATPRANAASFTIEFEPGKVHQWTVPPNVFSATFYVYGAQGGGGRRAGETCSRVPGGKGGETIAGEQVTPGDVIEITVGGKGGDAPCVGAGGFGPGGVGGFNGGGAGGFAQTNMIGGGGGGASWVNLPDAFGLPDIIGGGGGGGGGVSPSDPGCGGGSGGGAVGSDADCGNGGAGGTQEAGGAGGQPRSSSDGAGNGDFLTTGGVGAEGINTGDCNECATSGGGGGGGLYGGGGGGYGVGVPGGGGGGGSGYGPDGSVFVSGVNEGQGRVVIDYSEGQEEPPPAPPSAIVLCQPESGALAPQPAQNNAIPSQGSPEATQTTTARVCQVQQDPGRPPPEEGVLAIAVAQSTVAFGQIPRGQSSGAKAVGRIYYTNTLGTGNPWFATVAATSLVSESDHIPFAGMSFAPGATIQANTGATGQPTPGPSGTFAGDDFDPGNDFSFPQTLMNAPGDADGSFTHAGSTVSLFVPQGTPTTAYQGTLQYTIFGS